jgi:pimeloyl-ACP methyl ester carboxylesterase
MNSPDTELELAQAALVARFAPKTRVRELRWSGGSTQALELGSGSPLVLLHGGGDGAYEWVPLLGALSERYRVIAVDRPGHGLADPFDYRGVDLLEHARVFLGEILDALELESSAFLANSTGGLWAATFALERPERVSRLVLAGIPPGLTREAPFPLRLLGLPAVGRPLGKLMLGRPSREGNRKFWGQVLVAHPERLSDELLDVDVAHTRRNVDSILGLVRLVVGPRGVRRDVLLGTGWHAFTVPTLFLNGERDAFQTPAIESALEAAASSNPLIELGRVSNAGHLPWLDEPLAFMSALADFMAPTSA